MPTWIPDASTLAAFLVAALALNLTPGADMTYVLTRAVGQGRSAGVLSALGVAVGSAVHTIAAAIGLSALLMQSQTAFTAIKYVGAAYLLFLAWKAVRSPSLAEDGAMRPAVRGRRVFLQGALTNLLNPKVALFILAFLPQFTDPARGHVAWQILFLGTLFNVGGTAVNIAVAWSGSAAAHFIRGSRRAAAWLRWFTALVFAGLAIRLVVAQRG
jgi:threonine/homoserine/homoserine lactone efflux protein